MIPKCGGYYYDSVVMGGWCKTIRAADVEEVRKDLTKGNWVHAASYQNTYLLCCNKVKLSPWKAPMILLRIPLPPLSSSPPLTPLPPTSPPPLLLLSPPTPPSPLPPSNMIHGTTPWQTFHFVTGQFLPKKGMFTYGYASSFLQEQEQGNARSPGTKPTSVQGQLQEAGVKAGSGVVARMAVAEKKTKLKQTTAKQKQSVKKAEEASKKDQEAIVKAETKDKTRREKQKKEAILKKKANFEAGAKAGETIGATKGATAATNQMAVNASLIIGNAVNLLRKEEAQKAATLKKWKNRWNKKVTKEKTAKNPPQPVGTGRSDRRRRTRSAVTML